MFNSFFCILISIIGICNANRSGSMLIKDQNGNLVEKPVADIPMVQMNQFYQQEADNQLPSPNQINEDQLVENIINHRPILPVIPSLQEYDETVQKIIKGNKLSRSNSFVAKSLKDEDDTVENILRKHQLPPLPPPPKSLQKHLSRKFSSPMEPVDDYRKPARANLPPLPVPNFNLPGTDETIGEILRANGFDSRPVYEHSVRYDDPTVQDAIHSVMYDGVAPQNLHKPYPAKATYGPSFAKVDLPPLPGSNQPLRITIPTNIKDNNRFHMAAVRASEFIRCWEELSPTIKQRMSPTDVYQFELMSDFVKSKLMELSRLSMPIGPVDSDLFHFTGERIAPTCKKLQRIG
ncbi:uncharacterized protein LOC141855663 isoform X2 [Brevipalpus obovatus]|uniref:uncharacterized protein LOC141855663 isoform X2 n=1 Tax=Brevipalpus obovatus TaxID=246614 RepID=UPI003D9F5B5D